jgi:hypothetical protein
MDFIGGTLGGLGGDSHFQFAQMILGNADGGMPAYANATFGLWLKCLRRGKRMGAFIDLPNAQAFQDCESSYAAHRERRNFWEFYQLPGVQQALAKQGSPGNGAPLFKQERQAVESRHLPGNIEGVEILNCVYGPIGSDQDAVLQQFSFWYSAVAVSRVDLLRNLQWSGPWHTAPSVRIKYLRMPELAQNDCPPGELNAMAMYMSQIDSPEFLAVVEERKMKKHEYDFQVQQMIEEGKRRKREEDMEYRRQVSEGIKTLEIAWRAEAESCRQNHQSGSPDWRQCDNEARSRHQVARSDLKNKTKYSMMWRKTSVAIRGMAMGQGEINACLGTSDLNTRLTAQNLVRRAYGENGEGLMQLYDLEYEHRYNFTINATEEYGALKQCKPEGIAKTQQMFPHGIREIISDIFFIDMNAGRISFSEESVITNRDIADIVMITTAWEAIETLQPDFFKGDAAARWRLYPDDPNAWECAEDSPCPGIKLYVDNSMSSSLDMLHDIRAPDIQRIEYVKGKDATGVYGDDHHQGAILVTTGASN